MPPSQIWRTVKQRRAQCWSRVIPAVRRISTRVKGALTRAFRLVRPTLLSAEKKNRQMMELSPGDLRARADEWAALLSEQGAADVVQYVATVPVAYGAAISRLTAIEAKAVGVVQMASVSAVGAFFAIERAGTARALGIIGLVYLTSSVVAAGRCLYPRARGAVQAGTMRRRRTPGLTEMAVAAEWADSSSPALTNWVTSSLLDLGRAGALVVVALLVRVL